ncbi:MAG: transposase [Spirochaetes bacterium]|nr:transposase [Spirochaetota bacterium]
MHHRNSQKRYYLNGAIYFITTVTRGCYPWFEEDIICRLFIDDLELCAAIKNFAVLGYKVNPDHVHLLIRPSAGHSFSEIMRSLKTNFSRNANRLLAGWAGRNLPFRERTPAAHLPRLGKYIAMAESRYGGAIPLPALRWQSSFHDHYIRDADDLENHIRYLQRQWIIHGLRENKWLWIAPAPPMKAGSRDPAFIGGGRDIILT